MRDKASEHLHVKMRSARDHMGVSQGHIQRAIGVPQSRLSQYENSRMDAIPSILLEYYAVNGINMSALFNPAITPDMFRDILKKNDSTVVIATHMTDCDKCATKDREIGLLQSIIGAKDELIKQLRAS